MNRNLAALAVTGAIIVSTTAGAAILTRPQHPARSAAHPTVSFTQTPTPTQTPDHGEIGNPTNVPSICLNLPEDLWSNCALSWRIPISRDHDISGPDQVAECIASYPVPTAKPELAICLDPNGPR
jgi:hypothetical protein